MTGTEGRTRGSGAERAAEGGCRLRRWAAPAALALLVAACGGPGAPAATEEGAAPGSPAVEPMAPSGEPSPIDGRYFSGSAVLELDRGAWTFVSRDLRLTGAAEFSKGRLVLGGEATCPERGTYAWTAAGRGFTLEAEEDPCPGRPVLLSKRWVPIASSTDRLRNGDHMVLSDLWFGTYRGERDVSEDERFEIEVLATVRAKGSFYFSPSILVGRPGQVLTLTVLNPDRRGVIPLPHSLVIDALGLDTGLLRPGDEATVTVTFPQEGALTFYCFYHAEDGQAGELRVAA